MVSSKATTAAEYLKSLPPERRAAIATLRTLINHSLPRGFEEGMQYGMLGWVVPLSRFPKTYNGQPLAIAGLASQKNYMSLYLMGIYADAKLLGWFQDEHRKRGKKLDMGKSCIRFRSLDDLALEPIAEVLGRMDVDRFIDCYESARRDARSHGPRKKAPGKKAPPRRATAAKKKPAAQAAQKTAKRR